MRNLLWFVLAAFSVSCAAQRGGGGDAPSSGAVSSSTTAAAPAPEAKVMLPDFTLETVDGDTFTLSDHLGKKVILMSFWATWCVPCVKELPHLEVLYQEEKDNGLMVVAVSMDEPTTVAEVGPKVRSLGLEMPVVLDTEQRAVRLYNRGRNAPFTVVIDKAGKIVKAEAGYNPGDEIALAKEIRQLLTH